TRIQRPSEVKSFSPLPSRERGEREGSRSSLFLLAGLLLLGLVLGLLVGGLGLLLVLFFLLLAEDGLVALGEMLGLSQADADDTHGITSPTDPETNRRFAAGPPRQRVPRNARAGRARAEASL